MHDDTNRIYAGVGARATPDAVLTLMTSVAAALAALGYTLRTGGAPGADQAFTAGAARARGRIEMYLPQPGYERRALKMLAPFTVLQEQPSAAAMTLAARYHPAWTRLSPTVQRLHARNAHQILGADLQSPARMVICWTADGSLDGSTRAAGGTGQALRIAAAHDVSVFNLARPEHLARLQALVT